jgi:hypothetical protein
LIIEYSLIIQDGNKAKQQNKENEMKVIIANRESLIIDRNSEEARQYDTIVKIQSSTSPQPFFAINFVDGKAVGGMTITEMMKENIKAQAIKIGAKIEE